jgi:hypothetical protein
MVTTVLLEREQTKTSAIAKGNDSRYFPRWEVNKCFECIEEGIPAFRSYTKDLTLGGTSVIVFDNNPAGNRVKLRIYLSDKEDFEADGRVVWRKLEPTHQLLGIVFESLSRKAQELFLRHAFGLNKNMIEEIRTQRPAEEEVEMAGEALNER